MANTLELGNGKWATGKDTVLAFNDENNNFKPLPFSFSRNSSGTVVNKDGLIETVGSGEPRIDFKDNTKGALLLEPTRTNKIPTSNDFNGSGWLKSDITATANQVVSPDGTLNASKLEATGNGSLRNQSEASFNDGYAYSIFVKKGNSRYVTIRSAFFTQSIVVGFDLDDLTSQANGKIEDYGNDWYRLSISKNISGDADKSGFFYLYLPDSLGGQTSVSGNYAYFYGGQIEDGSYATSYIPTNGSTVTRSAETANGSGDAATFNDSEGVLMFEGSAFLYPTTPNNWITITDGQGANNSIAILLESTGNVIGRHEVGGVNQSFLTHSIDYSNTLKIAFKYKLNDIELWINGYKVAEKTTSSSVFPNNTLNTLQLSYGTGSNTPYGNTKQIQYYDSALIDSELETLTSWVSFSDMAEGQLYTIE